MMITMELDTSAITAIQETVWHYYRQHGRYDLPWRQPEPDDCFDAYKIMVSEVMLQQTQVKRVIIKYQEFLKAFPTLQALAAADQGDVIRAWSGLGYNRRARFLQQAAQAIVTKQQGVFPQTAEALVVLPGIGVNTAGAILAYAFNLPVIFLETNIRTVYIHHFFQDENGVSDKEILELVSQTVDKEIPRDWYWALMDYGSYLKQTVGNISRQSKGYVKQSTFNGSKRQIRGHVLRELGQHQLTRQQLERIINDERLSEVLDNLLAEGLIIKHGSKFSL